LLCSGFSSLSLFGAIFASTRRELVAEEANRIGTAWLRIDLLPELNSPTCEICSAVISTRGWQLSPDCEGGKIS
jgi:hypothetical protein